MALRPDDLLIDNLKEILWKLDIGRKCFWQFTSFYGTFVNMGDNRFEGNRMASSFVNGDAGTGVLKSPLSG